MSKKNIRSNKIKETLNSYENLSSMIKENTDSAVKDLLDESVKKSLADLVDDDDEKEEIEIEDDDVEDADINDGTKAGKKQGKESDDEDSDAKWEELEDFSVGDGEYDVSGADEVDIDKLQAVLGKDDRIMVKVEGDSLSIQDNENDAEYTIDLSTGDFTEEGDFNGETDDDEDDEDEIDITVDDEDDEDEIDITVDDEDDDEDEIDITVDDDDDDKLTEGFVTNTYQKKTAMTLPKNGRADNAWDKGLPKGDERPYGKVGDGAPFTVELDEDADDDLLIDADIQECGGADFETDMQEGSIDSFVRRNSTSKTHDSNSSHRKARNASVAGVKVKGTRHPRYSANESVQTLKQQLQEIKAKLAGVNQIMSENKKLRKALGEFKASLEEAAVTNYSLGKIIKLVTENATTNDEKRDIVKRFGSEVHSIEESERLFESINRQLKNKSSFDLNESKQFSVNSSKTLNETKIYQDPSLLKQLDLIKRMNKCK